MAKRGAPANKGDNESFQVTIPRGLYDYLGYLAEQSVAGVSENDIASQILRARLTEMLTSGFHKIDVPRPRNDKPETD